MKRFLVLVDAQLLLLQIVISIRKDGASELERLRPSVQLILPALHLK